MQLQTATMLVPESGISAPPPDDGLRDARRWACDLIAQRFKGSSSSGRWLANGIERAITDVYLIGDRQPLPATSVAPHLHILVEGWVSHSQILADGRRQITDVLLPGDICPAVPSDEVPTSEIQACGPARVAVLDEERLCEQFRALAEQYRCRHRRETEGRLRARVVGLGRRDARQRLAHLIAETYLRLVDSGFAVDNLFAWPFTQEDVADMLGLTPVHINRVLAQLRSENLLVIKCRQVTILDFAALSSIGGFEHRRENAGGSNDRL